MPTSVTVRCAGQHARVRRRQGVCVPTAIPTRPATCQNWRASLTRLGVEIEVEGVPLRHVFEQPSTARNGQSMLRMKRGPPR